MTGDVIQLAHGGGGRLSRDLIHAEIESRFGAGPLAGLPDAATLPPFEGTPIFTTDSFVVQPLEFPGGSIGGLAVHGSVNDVAVAGGTPRWLSLGLILEEGLEVALLQRVLDDVRTAAEQCGVQVVTGDTKVVARGECDGLYINTAALGDALHGFDLGVEKIAEGDRVLVSGPIGEHGAAVMAARDGIDVQNGPVSDTGPVHGLVRDLQDIAPAIRFMRDPTRGGLAGVLNEMVEERDVGIVIKAADVPVSKGVAALSELLGLEPLHIACEGRVVAVCAAEAAGTVLERWQARPEGCGAACIGTVTRSMGTTATAGMVVMETITGGHRLVDVPRGELLPRIC